MCLYPKLIKNKYYLPTKKNNYTPPKCNDERLLYVAIGCGNCIECKKQKANEWRTRLHEELKERKKAYFVTLTISNESYIEIVNKTNITKYNDIAKLIIRRFLERWRKKYKKSLTHWFVTELGQKNTERMHLHGFIFNKCNTEEITKIWKYGTTFIGEYCTNKTINYCVKYIFKIDELHKDYQPIILCSKGIGAKYWKENKERHRFNNENTIEYYKLPNGNKIALPMYYRNHFWNDKERTKLWQQKLNEETIYVRGIPIYIGNENGINEYLKVLEHQRQENIAAGYGDNSAEWNKKDYTISLKKLNAK